MDERDIDWDRLHRYLTGSATPEELEALACWVNADPELRALAETLRTAGRPPGVNLDIPDARAAWQRLHRRIRRPPLRVASGVDPTWSSRRSAPRWRVLATAATVLLTVGTSILAVRAGWLPRSRSAAARPDTPMREVVTHRGERAVLDLPDGSRVVVAADSRLRIPTVARLPAARDVFLEGQAFFHVAHDSSRPFRVHAANGIAEDLGTEFVVTAYPETRGMRVVVAAGAVALSAVDAGRAPSRPLVTLTRGDLARLDSAGTATLTRGIKLEPYVAWADGNLAFDSTRLRDVILTLARWYDLDIRLADSSLAERPFTGTFRNKPAEQVLDLLALSLNLEVRYSGRLVILAPRSHPRAGP